MNDHTMSVEEARAVLELDSAPLPMRQAARTIIHQAEQIETLSRLLSGAEEAAIERAEQIERLRAALRQADKDAFWASADRYVGPGPLTYEEPDWATYNLHPGDMEAPE